MQIFLLVISFKGHETEGDGWLSKHTTQLWYLKSLVLQIGYKKKCGTGLLLLMAAQAWIFSLSSNSCAQLISPHLPPPSPIGLVVSWSVLFCVSKPGY